jgi:23S rRNA pseudouridine2605 synthase
MVDHGFDPNAAAGSGQAGLSTDGERVAKALARAGVASRREVERLIVAGRVRLNGQVLDTPAVKVSPGDVLTVDGAVVAAAEATRVWRYHKPAGLVTTHADPKGRPTVFHHLPAGLPRVISVGRLDLNTEGLLLLTNDGALARAMELPTTALVRRYRARARGLTTQAKLDRLKDGITVEGVRYGSIEAMLDKAKEGASGVNLWITLTLTEGKNREVRKVLEALGLTINRLIRLSYGPFQLGALGAGEVEEVGPRVIREQLARHIAPETLPSGDRIPDAPAGAGSARRGAGQAAKGQNAGALSRDALAKKTEYKTGWAKPKKRAGPPRPKVARPAAKPGAERAGGLKMTGRLKKPGAGKTPDPLKKASPKPRK